MKDLKTAVYTTKNHTGVFTDTLAIAEHFNRKHFRVVAIVERLLKNDAIGRSQIGASYYQTKQNKSAKMYTVTQKAFLVIVLSFTGADSDRMKGKFVDLFMQQNKELLEWKKIRECSLNNNSTYTNVIQYMRERLVNAGTTQPEHAFYSTIQRKIHKKATGRAMKKGGVDHNELSIEEEATVTTLRALMLRFALESDTMAAKDQRRYVYDKIEHFKLYADDRSTVLSH